VRAQLRLSAIPTIVSKLVLSPIRLYGYGGYVELHGVERIVGKEGSGADLRSGGNVTVHLTLEPDRLYVLDLSLDSYHDFKLVFHCDTGDATLPLESGHVLFAFKAPHDGRQHCVMGGGYFAFTFYQMEISSVH
jgi:hypothetical protein